MDWISVSVRHLENAPDFDKDIDSKSMQVYSLISSIDLIFESIKQLHRVFMSEKKDPFSGEKKCFKDRLFDDEDDNSYFKTIRACFGAHPVNLNREKSKRFASWPFDSPFNTGDLTVHLYSRDINEEDLALHLNIGELLDFLKIRYDYLDVIADKIENLFIEYQKSLSKQSIETKSNPLEQLYVLRSESEKRLDNDYYNGEIDDLIMIFEAEVTNSDLVPIADKYKDSLLPLIEEIKTNLQSMNIVDLDNDTELRVRSDLSRELSYELGKFYTWVHGDRYDPLLDYYLERFNTATDSKFKFDRFDEPNLTFLKSKLMLVQEF
ncbi:hypothetical protein AB4264_25140 [Vibrio sp. 10N.261.55.B8]|uniref:hypothetical protein n=2 Tax=unclassified Vibrio TaxID=2614977 RepID=UPI003553D90A